MRTAALLPLVFLACIRPAVAQAPDLIFADGFDLLGPGEACMADEECASGPCVAAVCCNTECAGTCVACDLANSLGTCSPIPAGTDPDDECGQVSCSMYYWGWVGDTCYRKADVPAAQATCGSTGACRATFQECTLQTEPGPAAVTCDNFCQDPTAGTCTGTTAGSCTNVDQGFATCGLGVCRVSAPRCISGTPHACVPNTGAASPETCNDVDDNCDGTIDNGSFADGREPNNACASYRTLPTVGSEQTLAENTLTLYPTGDGDYFRINASETDSSCRCCDFFCTDEDYQLNITLSVPPGAGSYVFCTHGSDCNQVASFCQTVPAGGTFTWTYKLDGQCPGTDSYSVYVRISAGNGPGFECRPYTLSYNLNSGVCNSVLGEQEVPTPIAVAPDSIRPQ